MKIAILFILLLFTQDPLPAQDRHAADETKAHEDDEEGDDAEIPHELVDPTQLETTQAYRDSMMTLRRFDEAKWKKIVGDMDYREAAIPDNNFEPPSLPWAGAVLKLISYIVVIGLIGWILYYLLRNVVFDLRIERTAVQTRDVSRHVEDIENLDIEALLAQARREGNFRVAIRLYYLGLLKKLDAIGMIGWKKDKTNRDYLSELFSKDFHYSDIQRLTVLYETVWYGEHTLRGDSFEKLTREFENVYATINTVKTP